MSLAALLLTGGFLAGYRTYLIGGLLALQAIVAWALGDLTLPQLLDKTPSLLEGLGLMALRAGIASSAPAPDTSGTPR